MWSYALRRILLAVPTLLGITIVTFLVIHLAPGDPAHMRVGMGEAMSEANALELIERTRERYGLDKPLHVQYLDWLFDVIRLDFGTSFDDNRPVMEKIIERIPVSLQLSFGSLLLSYLIAVPIGVFFSVRQGSWSDQVTTVILFMMYSVPNFWLATMAIVFLCGGDFFHIFPVTGLETQHYEAWTFWRVVRDRLWHLVLPIVCMTYAHLAYLSRFARAGMLEVIRQDYVLTARAKGLRERVVIFKHAFRNALIPLLTLLSFLLPAMLGGSVIIETIFSIPGMGLLTFEAILQRDYPTIIGITTVSAFLTLIGFIVTDILYAWADPRISFEAGES